MSWSTIVLIVGPSKPSKINLKFHLQLKIFKNCNFSKNRLFVRIPTIERKFSLQVITNRFKFEVLEHLIFSKDGLLLLEKSKETSKERPRKRDLERETSKERPRKRDLFQSVYPTLFGPRSTVSKFKILKSKCDFKNLNKRSS